MTRSDRPDEFEPVRLPGLVRLSGSRRRLARAHFYMITVAVALAVGTVASAFAGEIVAVVTFAYSTLFVGTLAVLPWVTQRPGLLHLRRENHGLVFPGSDYFRKAWILIIRSAVIGPVILVVLFGSGEISNTHPYLIAVCVLLTVLGVAGPAQMRRWRPLEVCLERGQVFVHLPSGRGYSLRWESVPPLSDRRAPLTWMLARGGDTKQRFPEMALSSDPVLVAEIIEFYRANPRLRKELGNGRCIDRIRTGRFRER